MPSELEITLLKVSHCLFKGVKKNKKSKYICFALLKKKRVIQKKRFRATIKSFKLFA